jgi:hypothetical protein
MIHRLPRLTTGLLLVSLAPFPIAFAANGRPLPGVDAVNAPVDDESTDDESTKGQSQDVDHLLPVSAAPTGPQPEGELLAKLERVRLSEDLIRDFSKRFGGVDRALMNLSVAATDFPNVFADSVATAELRAPSDDSWARSEVSTPTSTHWPVDSEHRELAREELRILPALTEAIHHFDYAHFYFVRGDFDASGDHYVNQVGFYGQGELNDGSAFGARGHLEAEWIHDGDPENIEGWRVVRWTVIDMTTDVVGRRYFEEVLADSIVDSDLLADLVRCNNDEYLLAFELEGVELPRDFEYTGLEQHPGISAVDLDRDGWEDIFVLSRWSPSRMLMNKRDGTFSDVSEQIGLAIDGGCASANFADFDNDGDLDVFIGRNRMPSIYLVNENGRFVDCTATHVAAPLPSLVSSVSVVDYDQDGLLDVYIATYAAVRARNMAQRLRTDGKAHSGLVKQGRMTEADHTILVERLQTMGPDDGLFDFPGPSNVLLHNVGGGRFERVDSEFGAPGGLFKNSFSGSWSDFDGDGDQDLFCANDFASDNLFRNDGGTFTDVTELLGAGARFGMGVSWGDYNGDGRMDAYVSNMFSKAGTRIASQVDGVDPRINLTTRGNTLLENRGDHFYPVSDDDSTVSKSGWSYGSQFADVDSDGVLDIIGLAGHYTAPKALSNSEDW